MRRGTYLYGRIAFTSAEQTAGHRPANLPSSQNTPEVPLHEAYLISGKKSFHPTPLRLENATNDPETLLRPVRLHQPSMWLLLALFPFIAIAQILITYPSNTPENVTYVQDNFFGISFEMQVINTLSTHNRSWIIPCH